MTATLNQPLTRFLDTSEVAALCGLAPQTLINWRCIRTDGPPFVKLGGRVRYERAAVEAWIRSRTVNPNPDND